MNAAKLPTVLTFVVIMARTAMSSSMPIQVDTSATENRHWQTLFTNRIVLTWDWAKTATRAELRINGMKGSFITNFTSEVSSYPWQVFMDAVPIEEDVYHLNLTFYADNDVIITAMTSRLAIVTGAFGRTVIDPSIASTAWAKARKNAVIPYDANWAESTTAAVSSQLFISKADGHVQTTNLMNAAGYTGWNVMDNSWGYGTFHLRLIFSGTDGEWCATLIRPPDGTMFWVK